LAELVHQGWVSADRNVAFYAVSSPVASPGIKLFEAIRGAGYDLSPALFCEVLPWLVTTKSEPQIVQHVFECFSIERRPENLIINAVKFRTTGVVDIPRFLLSLGMNVNWIKSDQYSGWAAGVMEHEGPAIAGSEAALHVAAENGNAQAMRFLL
jgi:hypothetical protein